MVANAAASAAAAIAAANRQAAQAMKAVPLLLAAPLEPFEESDTLTPLTAALGPDGKPLPPSQQPQQTPPSVLTVTPVDEFERPESVVGEVAAECAAMFRPQKAKRPAGEQPMPIA